MKTYLYQTILTCFCLISMSMLAQDCPDSCEYHVPTSLTPDAEEVDSEFLTISSNCAFEQFDFALYNRWGQLIFQTTDPKERFDCTDHETGTYVWMLTGEFCQHQEVEETGYITILR